MGEFVKYKQVPDLRFPEFSGEWEDVMFEEIYSFYTTNSLSRDKLNYENGNVKNIHYGDIHTKFQTKFDITKEIVPYINEDIDLSKISKDNFCIEGDLVIADASEDYNDIGKTIEIANLNNEVVLAGLHTFLARPNKKEMTIGFAGNLLKSWKIKKQIMTIAQGIKVLGISTKRLAKIRINLPTLPEQQMIADFLTTVDDKKQQLTRKKELLQQYKKGVMQQLFSQQIRFKDESGNDYPDWEVKRLGEVVEKIQDGNYGASYPKAHEFVEVGIPFLTSKALGSGGSVMKEKIDYLLKEKHEELKKAHLRLNDVLFTNRGANVGAIGYVDENIAHGNIGPQLTLLRSNRDIILPYFLYHSMSSFKLKKQVASQDSGSAMNFFGIGATTKFRLNVPCLKEQQKIADFLSGIDKKIELVKTQLTSVQQFKKGLLQQMFV